VPLSGITASAASVTTRYTVTAGRLTDLTGNTIALAAGYAGPGHRVGDTVRMRLGDNEVVSLRVVAVFDAAAGLESALLPAPLLAQHTSFGQANEILVRAAPGVPIATLASTLTGALADHPGTRIADRAAILSAFSDEQRTNLIVGYLLAAGIVGYTMIALANTMLVATAKRRREFATQRLVGSTRGQVLRMVGAEALLVGLAGTVLGTVVILLTATRFAPSEWGPLWIYPAIVGGAIGLTLLASLVAAILVLRGRPITAVAGGA
jgi:putative ABC transport system permease protein